MCRMIGLRRASLGADAPDGSRIPWCGPQALSERKQTPMRGREKRFATSRGTNRFTAASPGMRPVFIFGDGGYAR